MASAEQKRQNAISAQGPQAYTPPVQIQQMPSNVVQVGGGGGYGTPSYAPPPMPSFGAGGGGGGGGGASSSFTAQTSPALDALQGRYNTYLNNLEGNTGHIMDTAAAKLRDAREGGRTALQASEALRGVGTSNRMAGYDAATTRGEQGAIADITQQREGTLGAALQGDLGIARAPAELALSEKNFGLNAAQAQQQQANSSLQAYLSLLTAQRQSPVYTGAGGYY